MITEPIVIPTLAVMALQQQWYQAELEGVVPILLEVVIFGFDNIHIFQMTSEYSLRHGMQIQTVSPKFMHNNYAHVIYRLLRVSFLDSFFHIADSQTHFYFG